jgi:hypothetical protein
MKWEHFDADKVNTKFIEECKSVAQAYVIEQGMEASNLVQLYKKGEKDELNKTIGVNIFRPHEFDDDESNDSSLETFEKWLLSQNIDWKQGSESLKKSIDKHFQSAGARTSKGGRKRVSLDNLVLIENKKVAIEVETSINIDNGYYTLRQAIKTQRADYGMMIVPWFALGPGRADEGIGTDRLDKEFNGETNSNKGPIFRLSPIRIIDTIKMLLS